MIDGLQDLCNTVTGEDIMGTFYVTIEIGDPQGQRFEELQALVDSGSTTTVAPTSALRRMGITPARRETFEFADGRRVDMDMAETKVRVQGKETTTWVIFGEEDAGTLLGAYTLEGVLLGVDPYNECLVPVHGLLK